MKLVEDGARAILDVRSGKYSHAVLGKLGRKVRSALGVFNGGDAWCNCPPNSVLPAAEDVYTHVRQFSADADVSHAQAARIEDRPQTLKHTVGTGEVQSSRDDGGPVRCYRFEH